MFNNCHHLLIRFIAPERAIGHVMPLKSTLTMHNSINKTPTYSCGKLNTQEGVLDYWPIGKRTHANNAQCNKQHTHLWF